MATRGSDKPCELGDNREDVQTTGEEIDITNELKAYICTPQGDKPPTVAVIVYHDIYGWELPANRVVVDNLANHGYLAIMPDFFHGTPWSPEKFGDTTVEKYRTWISCHPQGRVDNDTKTTAQYIQNILGIDSIVIIGFCWGGLQIVLQTCHSDAMFKAAVGFYAVELTPQDVLTMKAPTLLIFGSEDKTYPIERIKTLQHALSTANRLIDSSREDEGHLSGPAAMIKIFDGMGHRFVHRGDRNDAIVQKSAEEAMDDMYTFLQKYT
ncbi:carboxymethylenebutenolidase homolog [Glandiceps talaboti]